MRTTSDSGPGHVLDGCSRWLLCLARARVRCSCDAILTFPALYPVPCAYPWWGNRLKPVLIPLKLYAAWRATAGGPQR